jgi:plastocyanin
MRSLRPFGLLVLPGLVALTAACGGDAPARPAPPSFAAAVDPATAGRVAGRVRLEGAAPDDERVRIDGDKACVALNGSDEQASGAVLLGADQALVNAFVYVKSGLEKATFPVPNEPVVIDQQKCRYLPRVAGVRVGQPLQIRNSDALLHNVRADGEVNAPFNQGQPVQGMAYSHTFTTREVMVPLKCDVHAWMRAYVGALEHPYFTVTGADGAFSLPDLPPGSYTIEAWHERFGTVEQTVTVGARESKDVALTFVAR